MPDRYKGPWIAELTDSGSAMTLRQKSVRAPFMTLTEGDFQKPGEHRANVLFLAKAPEMEERIEELIDHRRDLLVAAEGLSSFLEHPGSRRFNELLDALRDAVAACNNER